MMAATAQGVKKKANVPIPPDPAAEAPAQTSRLRPDERVVRPLTAIEIALMLLATLAVIAAAKVADAFLVPVVAGILLSYTLRPLVSLLERIHVPRIVAAATIIALLVTLVGATVYAVRDDLDRAIAELPAAARKLRFAAAEAVQQPSGPMSHMKAAAAELDRAAAEATGKAAPAGDPPATGFVVQLQGYAAEQSGRALVTLSQIFVALLLAFFLLAAGDTYRRKVTRIAGASLARRRVTVEVLNEIDAQIQAYMGTLLIANLLIALAAWAGLALLGLPNAGLWAAIIGVLHVVPYAGTAISAAAIGVAAFVEIGTLGSALLAVAMVVAIAMLIGFGLATWLQGRAARIHPVAVLLGILFFGWLWGGWGLLLGVPILGVLKSIADRVDAFRPVSELLASS
jgi:predicted PurR-regulated permease PerM